MKKNFIIIFIICLVISISPEAQRGRLRDYGVQIGTLPTGKYNGITDVAGVRVGHYTLVKGKAIRTGVTAILPHPDNLMMNKVPAAIYIANGFGKLTGYSQVQELGNLETPIILTNTLSVPTAADALIDYTLSYPANKKYIRSINPVVGETNDSYLNDIQLRALTKQHILRAIGSARQGPVPEGSVGAGTGTICFGYKGGIGTSSRILSGNRGGFTVGVLVQTNFGGSLTIAGIPVGRKLKEIQPENALEGSCMIVVATDAPITARNLKRLAKRALFGLARTGGRCSNGSGEYVIAFSTAKHLRIPHYRGDTFYLENRELRNDRMTPLFAAVIEATEEAVINSMFTARTVKGYQGNTVKSIPISRVLNILRKHRVIRNTQ